jgi:hypothetical protein
VILEQPKKLVWDRAWSLAKVTKSPGGLG